MDKSYNNGSVTSFLLRTASMSCECDFLILSSVSFIVPAIRDNNNDTKVNNIFEIQICSIQELFSYKNVINVKILFMCAFLRAQE